MRLASLVPIAIMAAILASGCTRSIGVRPSAPLQIVHTQYIPIPASLLQPCATIPALGTKATWGDLAQAYIALKAAFAQCSAQVQAIAQAQTGAAK